MPNLKSTKGRLIAGFAFLFLIVSLTVYAVHDLGLFELDNDLADSGGTVGADWATAGLFNDPPSAASGAEASTHVFDGLNNGPTGPTIFTTGGSKDDLDVSSWRHTSGSVPDKDDIENAAAALYLGPDTSFDADTDADLIIYFAADKFAANGDAQIGFWFFRNPIGLNGDGTFAGVHAVGDILALSHFTNGGAVDTIEVFEWVGFGNGNVPNTGGPLINVFTGQDCDTTVDDPEPNPGVDSDKACATVNSTNVSSSPFSYTPKQGSAGTYPAGGFFEGGLNLSAFGIGGCFSSVLAETRSSQSVTAQLKDFVLGDFDLCSVAVNKAGDTFSKAGDPAHYLITITNDGAVTLFLDDISDTIAGTLADDGLPFDTNGGNNNIQSFATTCVASLAANASCTIQYDYVVQAGDPDPLTNTVTVTYRGSAADVAAPPLTVTAITDSDGHSVDLFQPEVTVTKSGPASASVGQQITYSFTIQNTGNGPNLVMDDIDDTILGDLQDEAPAPCDSLATSASCTFTVSFTIPDDDPDPLVNVVTVQYHPGDPDGEGPQDAFPNNIQDTDDHSLDILAPEVTIVKTGDTLSKAGDPIDYTITVTNTGETSLTCDLSDTLIAVIPESQDFVLATNGSNKVFNVQLASAPASPDPLLNTATVTCEVTGLPSNTVTENDGHSVNLFQPSIVVTKSGPASAQYGDTITYSFTIDNTSSADTPDLTLDTVTDTILGDLEDDAPAACDTLASGASCSFTASHTVVAANPDPLVNVATAHYDVSDPDGEGPNGPFDNDITDNDDHSVDLFAEMPLVKHSTDTGTPPPAGQFVYGLYPRPDDSFTNPPLGYDPNADLRGAFATATAPDELVIPSFPFHASVCEIKYATGWTFDSWSVVFVPDGIAGNSASAPYAPTGEVTRPEIRCVNLSIQQGTQDVLLDIFNSPPGGFACSPGFWKNNATIPPWFGGALGSPSTLFGAVFAPGATTLSSPENTSTLFSSISLLTALGLNGGGFNELARLGTSAYLDSLWGAFPMSTASIISAVNAAFANNNPNHNGILDDLKDIQAQHAAGTLTCTESNFVP